MYSVVGCLILALLLVQNASLRKFLLRPSRVRTRRFEQNLTGHRRRVRTWNDR